MFAPGRKWTLQYVHNRPEAAVQLGTITVQRTMKNKYKSLDDLVESVFSVEIGLSEEGCRAVYGRMLANKEWQATISAELSLALSDEKFSWMRFFDEHDLYSAEHEDDARQYAERIFKDPLKL